MSDVGNRAELDADLLSADLLEHLESLDEEIIRDSMDIIKHCAEQAGKLEVLKIQRGEHKKTLLHRAGRALGDDDSWIDAFHTTLLEANDHMKTQAQKMLAAAIKRKRIREKNDKSELEVEK